MWRSYALSDLESPDCYDAAYWLPFSIIESSQMSNIKPWITDRFRQLIRARHSAYRSGNVPLYNKYRNKAQQLAKRLRKQYFERKVRDLRTSNPSK